MDIFLGAASFILGTILGSFLNVVALRYKTGVTLSGRSHCLSCGKTLAWYELIPLLSFVMQRGRCRACRSSFSAEYFLAELLTGLLFFGSYAVSLSAVHFVWLAMIFSVLMIILLYDFRHKIIPDGFAALFAVLAVAGMFFDHATLASVVPGLFDLLAGPIVAAPFFFLWLVSDGRWMGLGDAKLALGIGWMLGLPAAASALIIAFWVGAIAGLILIAVSRSRIVARIFKLASGTLSMKSELPFAPFLIAGTALVAFWPLDLLGLHAFLL